MALVKITPGTPWPLHGVAATRRIEQLAQAALPPHVLMQRAGQSVARLALALAPHAHTVWIACGPGNNGGDGLEAAVHLQDWGKNPVVTWLGNATTLPPDAAAALAKARAAGVVFADSPPNMTAQDLCIDALLGLGSTRAPEGRLAQCLHWLASSAAPVLAVDLPSGLDADTGTDATNSEATKQAKTPATGNFYYKNTLSLLTLKPGLFTGQGRDAAGQVWFDDLGVDTSAEAPSAGLSAAPFHRPRQHASHKGSHGDVAVVGGAAGMAGAALLAASAALHAGAGRVFVALLDAAMPYDPQQPELMFRTADSLQWSAMTVVCGCGGGEAVRTVLPKAIASPAGVVLDADALNAIANDGQLRYLLAARGRHGKPTVLTPHPLEAARLLGCSTAQVQGSRLAAAQQLADAFACVVVLKGSGTVVAAPGTAPCINPTGNALLATGGTGDVLAGFIGARLHGLSTLAEVFIQTSGAVYLHGLLADHWPAGKALTAGRLAAALASNAA
ncbi:MAG: NAD(P)H-hydrate dehydratase [Pseudomonadota bacterium]